MICNLDQTFIEISEKFSDLKGFEVILTGNLANGNLLENYKQYNKAEVCLVVPTLINQKFNQWKKFL